MLDRDACRERGGHLWLFISHTIYLGFLLSRRFCFGSFLFFAEAVGLPSSVESFWFMIVGFCLSRIETGRGGEGRGEVCLL